MTETQTRYLETFPGWLRDLGVDAEALADALSEDGLPVEAREHVCGGLNYLFKSLDLIPDGIDDIGYLDDAFVLRVAASLSSQTDLSHVSDAKARIFERLADESEVIREFLGDDYGRLEGYVRGLRRGAARGRSVADIIGNAAVCGAFVEDVRGFARTYESPSFAPELKNLIKLKAFFDAKLPR
jgi:uncharacterized membrane protein YkvA (DUF1232 family)